MKKSTAIVWGIILVTAGVLLGISALGIAEIHLFFDGWWTLFIIIPCAVGLFTEREKTGNLIGLAIGVLLLLGAQEVIQYRLLWKLLLPIIIVIVGLQLLFRAFSGGNTQAIAERIRAQGHQPRTGCGTFSGCHMDFTGQPFDGAELTATFGGVKCDLRGAIIEQDCVIKATAVFGGVEILMPPYVNVQVQSNSAFGGVTNRVTGSGTVTVYVIGNCLFGGVEIK